MVSFYEVCQEKRGQVYLIPSSSSWPFFSPLPPVEVSVNSEPGTGDDATCHLSANVSARYNATAHNDMAIFPAGLLDTNLLESPGCLIPANTR